MPTQKNVCVVLTAEAVEELKEVSHLMDPSLYGPLFCCDSVKTGDGMLEMAVRTQPPAATTIHIPMRFVRAIFNTADLTALDVYNEPTRPLPLTLQQLIASIQQDIAKSAIQHGNRIPVEVFRTIYIRTPVGLVNLAVSMLETSGFIERQPDGTYNLK